MKAVEKHPLKINGNKYPLYRWIYMPNLLLFPSSYPDVGRQVSDHQSNRGRGGQGEETGGKVWRLG